MMRIGLKKKGEHYAGGEDHSPQDSEKRELSHFGAGWLKHLHHRRSDNSSGG
jgi:hypothetical protein